MSYEVLARKWRPQQFDDVVGQEHVTRTLRNAIASGRLAHAYLFVGPRGTGKTSLARIFAKGLNCVRGPSEKPCDVCDACREIMDGRSLDVQEIDGASHTQVEQIRDLRDSVKYAPARGPFRIYIIDEVHMLSNAAFNALLKTLEEPPPHVKFMFATTEPEKIPQTILSRCQRFDLRRIPLPMIAERLRLISKNEGFEVDDEALQAIARGAEGGLRDAESALDQMVSFCGGRIGESDVLSVFGLVSRKVIEGLAEAVLRGDVGGTIRAVADMDQSGKDLQRLMVELMMYFRDLLVCHHLGPEAAASGLLEADAATLLRHVELASAPRVVRIAEIIAEAEDRMRTALSRRTLLEVTLIRCARAAKAVSLDEVLQRVNALRGGGYEAPPARADSVAEAELKLTDEPNPDLRPGADAGREERSGEDLRRLEAGWRKVVEKVGSLAVGLKGLLVDAVPAAVSGDTVTIAFDPEFESEIGQFDVHRNRHAMEIAVASVLGRKLKLAFVAREKAAGVAPAESEEPPAPSAGKEPEKRGRAKSIGDWAGDPAVRKVMDMFDGTIAEVRNLK